MWCWGSRGSLPFGPSPMVDFLVGSGEDMRGRKPGEWVGSVEGQRPLSLSPCSQLPVRRLEPGFLPGKPAGHYFTHWDNNSHSWFLTPSRRYLLGARVLRKQRLTQRFAKIWRRGSKSRKESRLPSPSLSPKHWAVTCQGL